MRGVASIIEPALDIKQIEKVVSRAHVALQDADRELEVSEKRAESKRAEQARRRLELGRALVDAKKACKHGEWLPFLERQGIADRTAREYMCLAGFKSATSGNAADLAPTRADAGIDKRPRKSEEQPDPPERQSNYPAAPAPKQALTAPSIDIDHEAFSLYERAISIAEKHPASRQIIVHYLRQAAQTIEEIE